MTLSPRVGGVSSKPTDVSPTPAGQRYTSSDCITTKMTYEFFNELITMFINAQTAYGVTNIPNDNDALKKLLDKLRTGNFDFTANNVTISNNLFTDDINEHTADHGINLDGTLLKDGTANLSNKILYFGSLADYIQFTEANNYLTGYENNVAGDMNIRFGDATLKEVTADDITITNKTLYFGSSSDYVQFNDTNNYLTGYESNTIGEMNIRFGDATLKEVTANNINFGDQDLNYYEVGTFTATFYNGSTQITSGSGTANVSSYEANFTRLGNLVTVNISNIVWDVSGACGTTLGSYPAVTTTGEFSIRGLPFNALKDCSGSYTSFYNGAGNSNSGSAYIINGTNIIRFSTAGFGVSFGIRGVTIQYMV